jgi:hypothetical protein
MDTAGDHAGHPSRAAAGPTATPPDLIPSDTADAGTHGHREPDTGHLDAQTPAPDTGHRTGPRGAPDARTGHRMPDTDADTVTTAQPTSGPTLAATPSERTLRRATVFVL